MRCPRRRLSGDGAGGAGAEGDGVTDRDVLRAVLAPLLDNPFLQHTRHPTRHCVFCGKALWRVLAAAGPVRHEPDCPTRRAAELLGRVPGD